MEVPVEVPVMRDEDLQRYEAATKDVVRVFEEAHTVLREVQEIGIKVHGLALRYPMPPATLTRTLERTKQGVSSAKPQVKPLPPSDIEEDISEVEIRIGKAEKAVLAALAQYQGGRTKSQVALLTGYSAKGGGFNNTLGKLRSVGYITRADPMQITHTGLSSLGSDWEPLPEPGQALVEHWAGQLPKAERTILNALFTIYPSGTSKVSLAEATGYEATGGGFNNALGKLRTLELITRGDPIYISETIVGGELWNAGNR